MSTALQYISVFLLACMCTNAAKLPKFITPCNRFENDLDDCATKEAIKVLPQILQGDKLLKLPPLVPFKVPAVKLDIGNNLKVKLSDVLINGLDNHEIKAIKLDMKNKHFIVNVFMPHLNVLCNYDIVGRILILPIQGNGPANITFVNSDFTYNVDFETIKKKGDEFLTFKNPKLDFTTERSYYHFDNLFNGDKRLGDEMNRFLYENWKEVNKDLSPAIGEVVSAIATSLATAYFGQIPLDEVLPIAINQL